MTSILLVSLTVAGLEGCATGKATEEAAAPLPATVALTGTNGDMGKYAGTWVSDCGREYRVTPQGRGGVTSGINTFRFTAASGDTVRGTLTVETYASRDCTGAATQATTDLTLRYAGSIPVVAAPVTNNGEEATVFTGSADRIEASAADGGNSGSAFNIGFTDNFGKFRLAPVDYFSSGDLVYTKK